MTGRPTPQRRTCSLFEGCRGTGYRTDTTDSGSGWMVYCTCAAGLREQQRDHDRTPTTLGRGEPS